MTGISFQPTWKYQPRPVSTCLKYLLWEFRKVYLLRVSWAVFPPCNSRMCSFCTLVYISAIVHACTPCFSQFLPFVYLRPESLDCVVVIGGKLLLHLWLLYLHGCCPYWYCSALLVATFGNCTFSNNSIIVSPCFMGVPWESPCSFQVALCACATPSANFKSKYWHFSFLLSLVLLQGYEFCFLCWDGSARVPACYFISGCYSILGLLKPFLPELLPSTNISVSLISHPLPPPGSLGPLWSCPEITNNFIFFLMVGRMATLQLSQWLQLLMVFDCFIVPHVDL